jgi:hypothetical protein
LSKYIINLVTISILIQSFQRLILASLPKVLRQMAIKPLQLARLPPSHRQTTLSTSV